MLLHDFVDVFLIDVGVPDFFGIHHHHRPFIATVEATRQIDANLSLARKFERLDLVLGVVAYLARAVIIAAIGAGIALVTAEKDVSFVIAHGVYLMSWGRSQL